MLTDVGFQLDEKKPLVRTEPLLPDLVVVTPPYPVSAPPAPGTTATSLHTLAILVSALLTLS